MTDEQRKQFIEEQIEIFPADCEMGEFLRDMAKLQPCEDAISRQAAIDAMAKWDWQELYLPIHFKQLLEDLPSVSTEKTGHWEFVQYDSNPNIGNWHCSECNRIVCGAITAASPVYSYKYCPNCGAKMEEETETCKDCTNKCIMYEPNMKGCKEVEPQESEVSDADSN